MITLNTWQLILAVVMIFLFGWGTGRTMGESRAWAKMDKQEAQDAVPTASLLRNMQQTIGNIQYRTEGATILAVRTDREEEEKNRIKYQDYIMKTPNGRYFRQMHSIWGLEGIFALTKEEAKTYFNRMKDQRVTFEEAFDEPLVDA